MADVMDSMGSLFQNKLFLQYLAGVGGAMSAGQPVGPAMNAVTQQNIQSQNMMKLMKTLLNPADDSKATVDGSGLNVKAGPTSSIFSNLLGGGDGGYFKADPALAPAAPSPVLAAPVTPAPVTPTPVVGGGSSVANPFAGASKLDFSSSDLAGLTTQDISTALGMKMKQDEISADRPYKNLLMENIKSEIDTRTPRFEIPGLGKVNAGQYMDWMKLNKDDMPNEAKLYEYAMKQGFKGSFMDFKDSAETTHAKDYKGAVAGGYKGSFNTWMLDMAKAGAINLNSKVEEKKAMSELGGQLYFNDPKWTEDIHKQTAAFDKDQAWMVPEKDRPLARSKVVVKTIEDKIAAGGGAIQSVAMDKDNKTMVWTVKWPSGDVKTIKQAVR